VEEGVMDQFLQGPAWPGEAGHGWARQGLAGRG
jgi:hypothetical protein